MKSPTKRETADLLSIADCNEYSSRKPILKLAIALPGVRHEFAAKALSSRKTNENAVAGWVILMLVIAVTGSFWVTNQLCGALAQRMQEMQRQRYRQQVAYPEIWKQGRHW